MPPCADTLRAIPQLVAQGNVAAAVERQQGRPGRCALGL